MAQILRDRGNWPKCGKHGLTQDDIESVFEGELHVFPDPYPRTIETRLRAVGRTGNGRHVFIVFTTRNRSGTLFIRPISARYMHKKEIEHYEQQKEKP